MPEKSLQSAAAYLRPVVAANSGATVIPVIPPAAYLVGGSWSALFIAPVFLWVVGTERHGSGAGIA